MKKFIILYFIIAQFILIIFQEGLYFPETLLFSLIIWGNFSVFYIAKFQFRNPLFLFGVMFHVTNLIHVFYYSRILNFSSAYYFISHIYVARETFQISLLFNFLSLMLIIIGYSIATKLSKRKTSFKLGDFVYRYENIFLLVGVAFFGLYLFSYGGFIEYFSNLYLKRAGRLDSSGLLSIFGAFTEIYFLGLLIKYHKIFSKGKIDFSDVIKLIFITLGGFLIAVSTGGRFNIAIIFFQIFLLLSRKNKKFSKLFMLIFISILAIFAPIKWTFLRFIGGHVSISELVNIYTSNFNKFIYEILGFHFGSYDGFLALLSTGRLFGNDYFFKPLTNLISIIIPRRFLVGTIFEYKRVFYDYNMYLTNVDIVGEYHFNYLGYFYIILGYLGIIIFSLLFGFFLGRLNKKYLDTDTKFILYIYLFVPFILIFTMNGSLDPYVLSLANRYIAILLCMPIIFLINGKKRNKTNF